MSFRTSKLFLLALLAINEGFLCESAIKVDDFPADVRKSPFYRDGAMHIPISKKASEDLYKHWVDQAFSGLMAAMTTAKNVFSKTSELFLL
uniref:Uncharacterized protein n=1 Tax=Heterorhabditis bacteriophora TaxID=37862 RepID=A0A1I7X531_HETBA